MDRSREKKLVEKRDRFLQEIRRCAESAGVLSSAARFLAENLRADRCIMITLAHKGQPALNYEYCREWVSPSVNNATAKMNYVLVKKLSESLEPFFVPGARMEPLLARFSDIIEQCGIQSLLAFPLISSKKLFGLIILHHCDSPTLWDELELELISVVARHVVVVLDQRPNLEAGSARPETDPLTGLPSRQQWEGTLEAQLDHSIQIHSPLCLAVMKVDNMERMNATYGYVGGDRILQAIGELLQANSFGGRIDARFGGAEFMMIFPQTALAAARSALEEIQNLVEATVSASVGIPITVCTGVVEASPETRSEGEALIHRALIMLYAQDRQMEGGAGDLQSRPAGIGSGDILGLEEGQHLPAAAAARPKHKGTAAGFGASEVLQIDL